MNVLIPKSAIQPFGVLGIPKLHASRNTIRCTFYDSLEYLNSITSDDCSMRKTAIEVIVDSYLKGIGVDADILISPSNETACRVFAIFTDAGRRVRLSGYVLSEGGFT